MAKRAKKKPTNVTRKKRRGLKSAPRAKTVASHGLDKWGGRTKDKVRWEVQCGDAREVLKSIDDDRFACVITSPPYYSQRDYGVDGQIGLEKTIDEYVGKIVDVFKEVKRVLSPTGTLFLNLGDTYYSGKGQPVGRDRKNGARRLGRIRPVDASGLGVPKKTAIGIPWRVALGMIADGWILRCPIVWVRKAAFPEPTAQDRPWKTYEMLFLFAKTRTYHFDRARLGDEEDVWTISERPTHSRGIHSAAFPPALVKKCLEVGCKKGGEVLDPFAGCGTVMGVALASKRRTLAIDLSNEFCQHMAQTADKL